MGYGQCGGSTCQCPCEDPGHGGGDEVATQKNGSHETKACGRAAQERTGESREGLLEATQRAIGCGDKGDHAQASHCLEEKIGAEGQQDYKSTRPQSGAPYRRLKSTSLHRP